ncbi:MAG: hypothetical protein J1F23_06920 [Oscillospiraceae bacterium]|nr:hypothetical protein [Oscillospiraceae bacterium]
MHKFENPVEYLEYVLKHWDEFCRYHSRFAEALEGVLAENKRLKEQLRKKSDGQVVRTHIYQGQKVGSDEWVTGSLIEVDKDHDGKPFMAILEKTNSGRYEFPYLDAVLGTIDGCAVPVKPETVSEIVEIPSKSACVEKPATLEAFNKVFPNSVAYVNARLKDGVRCNACGSIVLIEDEKTEEGKEGAKHQCMFCDIDLLDEEVHEGDKCSIEELYALYGRVAETLLLDDSK